MIEKKDLITPRKAATLAVFRILFGLLMALSVVRFWANGWIEKLYLTPKFHFHYLGFEWVQVPGKMTYFLFLICFISAMLITVGYKYRSSIIIFFLSFTYIELMDKTTYLNHYYFISVLSFIMIFLPMHVYFSIDAKKSPSLRFQFVQSWHINCIKLFIAIVYIYAGIAKLNTDWLCHALPLSIWLETKTDIPIIGNLLDERWVHFLFSWSGAIYDLGIVFLLLWKRTRFLGFTFVVIFHILTRILFPIGIFPFIMIFSALIFFSDAFHEKLLSRLGHILKIEKSIFDNARQYNNKQYKSIQKFIVGTVLLVQLTFPWRHLLYDGNLFWHEQGYRYSWRVMLMEKTGYANFKIVDAQTQKRFYVQNEDFLTAFQQKQMSTQPDFIIEYAHYLADHFSAQGHENIQVFVESYASLNGRPLQKYIKPNINLLDLKIDFKNRNYIEPLNN